jgi:tetratricopeptide (TPR) repeat protein
MKIDKSKTEQEKQAYRDTLFMVYDQQIKVYPDKKGFVLGMKTLKYFDFYIKGQKLDDTAVIKIVTPKIVENYNMAMEAIELSGEQTGYYVFPIAFTLSMYQRDLGNLVDETVIEKYLSYSDILAKQLSAETDAAKKEKIQKGGVDIVDMIFSKSDLSTCVHLCPTMETKYQRNPTDAKNLKSILSILSRKNCLDCQIYTDVAVKLFELEPSSNSAYSLALLFVNKEKYTDAATYFDKAIELEKVDTVKAKFYFEAAKMYAKQSQYSKCREYARGAINLKPNFGAAYVLIADIYANSAGSIGNDQFSKSAVYWVVVDKLLQAKSVDPSIAEEVDKKIGIYSSRYPAKEEGFMQSVLEGSSYSVGGWIGETTTARYLR